MKCTSPPSDCEKYKDKMYYVRRTDGDTLILSNKYLEELRLFPNTVLSNAHAQYQVR